METERPTTWLDILKTGVSGVIDSQIAKNYAVSDPAYNTAGGRAGQSQTTLAQAASNPAVLIVGALLVGVVIFLAVRR